MAQNAVIKFSTESQWQLHFFKVYPPFCLVHKVLKEKSARNTLYEKHIYRTGTLLKTKCTLLMKCTLCR